MRHMHNLVKYCVQLIESPISQLFQDTAAPNLVCRYYRTQKVTSANGCYGDFVTMVTKSVIDISQYKVAAVSYLTTNISAILRPRTLKFGMKMPLYPVSQSGWWLTGELW